MKTLKKMMVVFAAVTALVIAVAAFSACGGRKISGTFKIEYDNEYVSTNMAQFEGGAQMFLTMAEAYSFNTLVMKDDGTYEYTKDLEGPALGLSLAITYTGEYSDGSTEYKGSTENSYVLGKPSSASWKFTPGMTVIAGWGDGTAHGDDFAEVMGKEYTGDLSTKIIIGSPAEEHDIIDYFLGPTLLFSSTEGMTDDEISVEVALDGEALVYLGEAE